MEGEEADTIDYGYSIVSYRIHVPLVPGASNTTGVNYNNFFFHLIQFFSQLLTEKRLTIMYNVFYFVFRYFYIMLLILGCGHSGFVFVFILFLFIFNVISIYLVFIYFIALYKVLILGVPIFNQ